MSYKVHTCTSKTPERKNLDDCIPTYITRLLWRLKKMEEGGPFMPRWTTWGPWVQSSFLLLPSCNEYTQMPNIWGGGKGRLFPHRETFKILSPSVLFIFLKFPLRLGTKTATSTDNQSARCGLLRCKNVYDKDQGGGKCLSRQARHVSFQVGATGGKKKQPN